MKCNFTIKKNVFASASRQTCGREAKVDCIINLKNVPQLVKTCLFHACQIAIEGLIARLPPAFLEFFEIDRMLNAKALYEEETKVLLIDHDVTKEKFFFRNSRLMRFVPA